MTTMTQCYVCGTESELLNNYKPLNDDSDHGGKYVNCPQCGTHYITNKAINMIERGEAKRHLVSHYIRKRCDDGEKNPEFDSKVIASLKNTPEIPLSEKADLLLLAFARDATCYVDVMNGQNPKYIARTACTRDDYYYCLNMLVADKILEEESFNHISLTFKGWKAVDTLKKKQPDSKQGFVAMWFDPQMHSTYDTAIEPAIIRAGFNPYIVRKVESNDKIDDLIIAEIQRSRFLIADLTGHRGGVYFEAGYALGRGIPVIWTCRKNHFDNKENGQHVHFDINHYNFILWETEEELRKRLYQRIRATIGT
jgi:nucleoside 2-deoxyribosyltransferase/DNA-directed RNA polymerase subunit RPC12/RpoP